jgi:hypothetical protein
VTHRAYRGISAKLFLLKREMPAILLSPATARAKSCPPSVPVGWARLRSCDQQGLGDPFAAAAA